MNNLIPYISLALGVLTSLVIPFGAFLYRSISAQQAEIIRRIETAQALSDRHTEQHVFTLGQQISALKEMVQHELAALEARVRELETRQQRHEVNVATAAREYMPRDEISEHLREIKAENKRIAASMDAGFKEIMEKIHG